MMWISAVKRSIGSITVCTITEKAPTRAFSWLKAPTSAFTFKTLLRHYAKRALTPLSLMIIASQTLVGAFSVIVQPVVEPMDRFTALLPGRGHGVWRPHLPGQHLLPHPRHHRRLGAVPHSGPGETVGQHLEVAARSYVVR